MEGAEGMEGAGGTEGTEGALIRFLAPAHKSRMRLVLMALLLAAWIAILIGFYLATPHLPKHPSPASSGAACDVGDAIS